MSKKIYAQKAKYIESLRDALSAMQDFDSISYARKSGTEEEFLRISDTIGRVVYIDVTAETMEEMLKDVARVILVKDESVCPKGVITDEPKLRKIATLFR